MDRAQRSRRTKARVDYAGLDEDGGGSDNDFADAPASANKKSKAAAPKEQQPGASEAGDQRGRKKASRLDRQAKLEERFNCDLQHAIEQSLQTIASADVRCRSSAVRPSKQKPLIPGDDSDGCGDADDFKAANASLIVVDDDDCAADTSNRHAKPRVTKKPSVAASSTTEPSARGVDASTCPALVLQDVITSPRRRGRPKKDDTSPDAAAGGVELVRTAATASAAATSANVIGSTGKAGSSKRAQPKQKASHCDGSDDDGDGDKSDDDDFNAEEVSDDGSDEESDADSESDEDENRRPNAKISRRRGAATKSPSARRQSTAARSAMKSSGPVTQQLSPCPSTVSVAGGSQVPCRWKPPAMLGQVPSGRSGSGGVKVSSSGVATASRSPGTLRLGLSKMTRLKPLHPSVKST